MSTLTEPTVTPAVSRSQSRSVRRIAFSFVLVVVCVWLVLSASGQPENESAATGGIALGLWCLALSAILPNSDVHQFRLRMMPLILVGWSIVFGFTSYAWLQTPQGTPGKILPSSVTAAEWMVGLAATAMWAGYWLTVPTSGGGALTRYFCTRTTTTRLGSAAVRMYGLASLARLALYATSGTVGYTGSTGTALVGPQVQVLNVLAEIAPAAILVASYQAFVERLPGAQRRLAVLVVLECGYATVAGIKEPIVYAFISAGLPWLVNRGKVPIVAASLAALAFVFVVVPANSAFRSHLRDGSNAVSVQNAVSFIPQILRSTVQSVTNGDDRAAAVGMATSRIRNIDNVAIIVQLTPSQIPFRSLRDLLEAPVVGFVPRAVWPSKPVFNVGQQFSRDYYQLGTTNTASSITPIGDLYRYGGWVVLLSGMVLLGVILRFLDQSVAYGALAGQILFISLGPMLAKAETDALTLLASIPSIALGVWLAVSMATRRSEEP